MSLPNSERVIVLAPLAKDAEIFEAVLSGAGIGSFLCRDVASVIAAFLDGAAAALIAEEALNPGNVPRLAAALAGQPSWSDFPLLLLTDGGESTEDSRHRLSVLAPLGNITLLERPLRTPTLLSAVQSALRARRHQYQIRDQLNQQQALMAASRENEEKLQFVLDAAQLGSWELRLSGKELLVSDQCRRNFGLAPGEPMPYSRLFEIIHPDDRDFVSREVELAIREKRVYKAEYRIVRPDGTRAWIYAAGRLVYEADGAPARMIGVTLDVTERRKGEEAIRESEMQLRALADSMPQLAWMADPDGNIFWYNRRWFEYTGTTLEQMKGWGWQAVHHPNALPQVMAGWRTALDTGTPFEMEFPLRSSSGAYRWFLTQARPVRNPEGDVVRWFGTNTDIDDKKAAQEALRESEELASSIIQSSPDCVEVLNSQGGRLLVNPVCCRLLGIAGSDRSNLAPWLDSWTGEDRERAELALERAASGEHSLFQASGRDTSVRKEWWEVIVSPIKAPDGATSKILCVSRDITARRKVEEELRQTAKLESLGVMAGGIAHDFNNLLTGILGNASLLVECVQPENRPFAEDVVLAAERAADLTKQMLAYSGKGRFELKVIDLSALVLEMLRLVKPTIDKNVSIDLNLMKHGCLLEGDSSQIQQVIMNLLTNAGEALNGAAGTVVVTTGKIDADAGHLAQTLGGSDLAPGEYVFLEVHDTGMGMDEETQARMFDPFFTTKFTGRGLGLAAVSGIVRGHRGAMSLYSVPGQGTTFRVFFPAVLREAPVEAGRAVLSRGNGLILLVDDEEIVQRLGAAALERHGYQVQLAANGKIAVDLFAAMREEVKAVVLDMTMPVMNGEETLRRIRAIDVDVPVILCSGYNEVAVIQRFAGRNVSAFLQKPYTASTLVNKIQSVVFANSKQG